MKKMIIGLMLALIILPIASADIIMPGTHGVYVRNEITNINDFPDYVFVSGGPIMCDFVVIENDGVLLASQCYKNSPLHVYAIPKSGFNDSVLDELNKEKISITLHSWDYLIDEYISALGGKKVLENIIHSMTISDSDPTQQINNFYQINLDDLKTKPDDVEIKKDARQYLYLIIPLISLFGMIGILIKRHE